MLRGKVHSAHMSLCTRMYMYVHVCTPFCSIVHVVHIACSQMTLLLFCRLVKMNGTTTHPKAAAALNGTATLTAKAAVNYSMYTRLSSYLIALRPWSFATSMCPVILGCCLANKTAGVFNVWIFVVTCVTALCVHAAGNLVNTYYDYRKGVDSQKSSGDRTLVDNILSPDDVVSLAGFLYTAACLGFLILTWLSPTKMEVLAVVYFGGMSGSFLYTGGLGLKYIALGDVMIFLTFGPVTVLFAYLSQGGEMSLAPLVYTIPLALNTETILHANNTRDMLSDQAAGVVTLAILCGKSGSYALFAFILFVPYLIIFYFMFYCSVWFILPAVTIFLAFRYEKLFRKGLLEKMPERMAALNLQFGLLYAFAILMSVKEQLPLL